MRYHEIMVIQRYIWVYIYGYAMDISWIFVKQGFRAKICWNEFWEEPLGRLWILRRNEDFGMIFQI